MTGGDPDVDALWAWLLGLRDPLLSVEHRLAAQSGVLRSLQDVPGATTDILAGVLAAIGQSLVETADAIDWGPLQIDGRPAVNQLAVQVGRFRVGHSALPADRVIRILMSPPRISRVFDEPLSTAAWGVVAAATVPDVPILPVTDPSGGDKSGGRIRQLLAADTGPGVGALATAEAAFAAARWILAANDVIGREWAPSETMLRVALDDAVSTSTDIG